MSCLLESGLKRCNDQPTRRVPGILQGTSIGEAQWAVKVRMRNRDLALKDKASLVGDDLLLRGLAPRLPSARKGLTTGFGMGPGVPTSLKSPRDIFTMLV